MSLLSLATHQQRLSAIRITPKLASSGMHAATKSEPDVGE